MQTLSVELNDELNAALEAVSARDGRSKADFVVDLIRKVVDAERLRSALQDPELINLYQELAAADVALAKEGVAEYRDLLHQANEV